MSEIDHAETSHVAQKCPVEPALKTTDTMLKSSTPYKLFNNIIGYNDV
jgi:hypothetical protein